MSLPTRRLSLLSLTLLLAAACGGEGAGSDGETAGAAAPEASTPATAAGSDDLAALEDYELSMEKVDRYYAAYRNMGLAVAEMTPEERERQEEAIDASDATLDEYAAQLEGNPVFREAIEEAGLSAREFAVMTMAMVQAGMAQAVVQMRPDANADSLAREMQANPANIQFMREHAAEIEAKQQALQQEFERLGIADD